MKSSAWDNRLWQSKMQELPIYADEDFAWNKMQALLDEHMPVNAPVVDPKKPFGPFGTRLISIFGALILAALLYYAATHMYVVHEHKSIKNIKPVAGKITRPHSSINHAANNNPNVLRHDNNTRDNSPGNTTDKTNNTNTGTTNIPAGKNTIANTAAIKHNNSSVNTNENLAGNNKLPDSKRTTHGGSNTASYLVNRQKLSANTGPANLGVAGVNANMSGQTLNKPNINKSGYQNKVDPSLASATNGNNAATLSPPVNNNTPIKAKIADSLSAAAKDITNKQQAGLPNNVLTGLPGNTKTSRNIIVDSKGKTPPKKPRYTRFGININTGINTKANSSAFLGLSGSYLITSKLSVGVGIQLLPSKVIVGNYSNHNYKYTTAGDSGKTITNIANNITVSNTVKIFSADEPVIFSYKLNNHFSLNAGPIFSIPVNTDNLKNTLGVTGKPADTTVAYKLISAAANNVTISDKVRINLEGGIRINISRFYIDGAYVQGINPYMISTSLGSSKVYYHTFQFGLGYWIFKPKPKPKSK
jgi:hypothetical protein